jgi:hypothetical protein
MDLLIACHCERLHSPLFTRIPTGQQISIEFDPTIRSLEYVDVRCPEKPWSIIQAESKDMIWTMHCPLYTEIYWADINATGILRDILTDSWRVLKPGGILAIPIGTRRGSMAIKKGPIYNRLADNKQAFLDYMISVIGQHPTTPFEVELVSSDETLYIKNERESVRDSIFFLRKPATATPAVGGSTKKVCKKKKTRKVKKAKRL